jgi:predicted DNA-binding WGR domain protein
MDRYELNDGSSAKFWEAEVDGSKLTVRFGRIGTQGQTKEKSFASPEAARKEEAKLIKEKTGKGYVKTGDAAPAETAAPKAEKTAAVKTEKKRAAKASPVAEAADEPAAEAAVVNALAPAKKEDSRIFSARPLPTRMRPDPDGPSTPDEIWEEFRQALLVLKKGGKERPSPETMSINAAVAWGLTLCKWEDRPTTRLFMKWLVRSHGALLAVQVASRVRLERPDHNSYYKSGAWTDVICLALRAALTSAPEAGYDEALAWCLTDCEGREWEHSAFFAFILADDRPERHALQPLAVLQAGVGQGVDVGNTLESLPLIADAPPFEVAAWRIRKSYFIYFTYMSISADEACATVMAVAKANGQQAVPPLSWLLHYGNEQELTRIASAILETREDGALVELLPVLHQKWIREAVERAAGVDPEFMFRQCLAICASGRNEPAIRARIADLMARHGKETARAWANDLGGKEVKYLEALTGDSAALASPEALPPVLRDPPWRRKQTKSADIVLAIQPIATPFACALAGMEWDPEHSYRLKTPLAVKIMQQLPSFLLKAEATRKKYRWGNDIPASAEAPTPDMSVEDALAWLAKRLTAINRVSSFTIGCSSYDALYESLERLPESLALMLWELTGPLRNGSAPLDDAGVKMLSRFGEAALPGLLKLIEATPIDALALARHVDAPEIAPLAARAMLRLKKTAHVLAMNWLRAYRRTAMTRLIPNAVGAQGEARDAAGHVLRWFVKTDAEAAAELAALVEDYAKSEPRIRDAMEQVLNRDPLLQFPAKIAKLPSWLAPGALTRPTLRDGGGALPDDALAALAEMVSFSTQEVVYPGIAVAREACAPQSVGVFVWDLFSAWIAAGAPSKEGWALRAVGWLGDDECARKLTRLIRKWPGESAHARAVTGLDVLADIGSDVALMNLNGVAEKVKFKGLQEKAREKIAAIAEARDLTPEELADRLAPDLDLDERGGLDLNFGPRHFRVGFDEFLKPWVKDANTIRLKELPKPNKSDDAELSAAAVARWSALKKDARAVASLQLARLESMLAGARRVRPDVFWAFFASHPLIRHLAQRLVWGLYDDNASMTRPSLSFRVGGDLTFSDSADNPAELDLTADAKGVIGLVHPLQMAQDEIEAWGVVFGDYEIMQPFPQLGRETYALTDAEKESASIDRFTGVEVESPRLRGMAARGWPLGSPQDGGGIWWIERDVNLAAGGTVTAYFSFKDGLIVGGVDFEEKTQTLEKLELESPWRKTGRQFGDLDPVAASEMLRGLTLLAQTGKS